MREAIDKLIDRVKSPRFHDDNYYEAINQATLLVLNDRVENIKAIVKHAVQLSQRLRDELTSLVVNDTALTVTGIVAEYPADYFYLLRILTDVNGIVSPAKPTTYNEESLLDRNPFKAPTDKYTYYNEGSTGWRMIYPPASTLNSVTLDYLKNPIDVTIGNEGDQLVSGDNLLAATDYIVKDKAIIAGVTYYDGDVFRLGVPQSITSGVVILRSTVIDSDMPSKLQDEIIRLSAAIMDGTVEDYQKQNNMMNYNKLS